MVEEKVDPETMSVAVSPFPQLFRNPSVFQGEAGQDPTRWLKEYDRVSKYNKWDDMFCLANVYFFLDGTARQWYENNEDQIPSWNDFKSELTKTFGDSKQTKIRAGEELKVRVQKLGESTQSYIQSVLRLCQEVNPDMPEEEKISHFMKGISEDIYQFILTKQPATTKDFIKWCQYSEEMKQKRVGRKKFDRLPNVVPLSAIDEEMDLASLIRKIVREEIRRVMAPSVERPDEQLQSIEAIVREEVEEALSPISKAPTPWTGVRSQPRRQRPYPTVSKIQRPPFTSQPRRTDQWRTTDNRPVCFHCGRPGHVVRYCRERRAIFDDYRNNRRNRDDQGSEIRDPTDYNRSITRSTSPSPTRGRSPMRRYRSPSPYRRSSLSPGRHSEGN